MVIYCIFKITTFFVQEFEFQGWVDCSDPVPYTGKLKKIVRLNLDVEVVPGDKMTEDAYKRHLTVFKNRNR